LEPSFLYRPVQVPGTGEPGQSVQILVSPDRKNWNMYTTLTLSTYGAGQFSDSSLTNYGRRFLRAVAQ
jgi:hypothetical protein